MLILTCCCCCSFTRACDRQTLQLQVRTLILSAVCYNQMRLASRPATLLGLQADELWRLQSAHDRLFCERDVFEQRYKKVQTAFSVGEARWASKQEHLMQCELQSKQRIASLGDEAATANKAIMRLSIQVQRLQRDLAAAQASLDMFLSVQVARENFQVLVNLSFVLTPAVLG